MEFNPRKLGKENVQKLIEWYDQTFVHSTFYELVSVKKCISMIDIAIDIIGIHISNLMFDLRDNKTVRWHSGSGLLETFYWDIKKNNQSSGTGYDCSDYYDLDDDENKDDKDQILENYKICNPNQQIDNKTPVTRIEKTIKKPKHALLDLHKMYNKFKQLEIFYFMGVSKEQQKYMIDGEHNFYLFLESIRNRGKKNALSNIPLRYYTKYNFLLSLGMKNTIEPYNDTEKWKEYWLQGLINSGLYS